MPKNRLLLWMFLVVLSIVLAGCFQGEQTLEPIDVPEEVTVIDEEEGGVVDGEDGDANDGEDEELDIVESEETVLRELYLLDASGMVVPQTLELPKTESAAKQSLEYLVKDGPVTELLPNGFQAVLPAGTEILGVNLDEEGTLTVDVSEDFKQYDVNDELKILQAMTYTLTQFDSVERIKLWINGELQSEMPVGGTPISEGYSKSNGINIFANEKPNLQHSKVVTIFYPKSYHDQLYYVPVTQYVDVKEKDVYTSIVQTLLDGPAYELGVLDVFNDYTALVNKPFIRDGVLQLVFNEDILKDSENAIIADEVMESLVRTLTAEEEVEAVDVKVENKAELMNEAGTTYDKPVTTNDFNQLEKM